MFNLISANWVMTNGTVACLWCWYWRIPSATGTEQQRGLKRGAPIVALFSQTRVARASCILVQHAASVDTCSYNRAFVTRVRPPAHASTTVPPFMHNNALSLPLAPCILSSLRLPRLQFQLHIFAEYDLTYRIKNRLSNKGANRRRFILSRDKPRALSDDRAAHERISAWNERVSNSQSRCW
jgi:hypothetical protein